MSMQILQLQQKIRQKIEQFTQKNPTMEPFEPLEIIFFLGSPVLLSYPWILFDGLIAHIYAEMILEEVWDQLPLRFPLDFTNELPMPIKKTGFLNQNNQLDFIYHASISRFSLPNANTTQHLHKHFSSEYIEHIHTPKHKYDGVRGDFKQYDMTMIYNYSPECRFWCCGNKTKLEEILPKIICLGKKRAIGCGKIMSYSINVLNEDWSLKHPEYGINRPIPVELNADPSLSKGIIAHKPPYWSKANHTLCVIPGGF